MNMKIESIKAMTAAAMGGFSLLVGASYKHIAVLLLLMAVDTVIGWIKGFKLGEWKSNKARWGAIGKIVELMLIGCLYGLDWLFEIECLKYIGIYYFGICEIASMFESFAEMGGNVPKGMVELLRGVQYNVGTEVVKKVKRIIEDLTKGEK